MKKFFMFLAVAGFFSMATVSCGDKKADGDDKEQHDDAGHGDEGHAEHAEH